MRTDEIMEKAAVIDHGGFPFIKLLMSRPGGRWTPVPSISARSSRRARSSGMQARNINLKVNRTPPESLAPNSFSTQFNIKGQSFDDG